MLRKDSEHPAIAGKMKFKGSELVKKVLTFLLIVLA
jgi:hypothetical protein